jgi:hypothetical protein
VKVKISPTSKEETGRDRSLRTGICCSAVLLSLYLNALPNEFFNNTPINTTHSIIRYTQRSARPRCIRKVLGSILDQKAGSSDFGFWRLRKQEFKKKLCLSVRVQQEEIAVQDKAVSVQAIEP